MRAAAEDHSSGLSILLIVAVGSMVTVQSKINGELAGRIGSGARAGLLAAVVSFGFGLVLLTLLVLASAPVRARLGRLRTAVAVRRLRPWHLLGGIGGASLVAAQGLTVGTIGVALFTVAVIAGQTSSALAVDHAGVGPAGRRPVLPGRALGALLAVVAVGVASSGRLSGSEALGAGALSLALLPLLAGASTAWQQAVNGRVALEAGPWGATFNNFAVGTTALVICLLLSLLAPGRIDGLPGAPWLYSGGAIGVVFIAAAAVLVRHHGVLIFGLGSVAGQLGAALAIDAATGHPLSGMTIAGGVLALAGVAVAAFTQLRARNKVIDG